MALLLPGILFTASAWAMSVPGDIVYQDSSVFKHEILVEDEFNIETAGFYQATLSDLMNTTPFTSSGLTIMSGASTLGSLSAPGSFVFEATSGEHNIDFFASITVSDETKEALIETMHMERFEAWKASLSTEELNAYRETWKNRTDEERSIRRTEVYEANKRRVEKELDEMTGEYDVVVSHVDGYGNEEDINPVPTPAAAWLFGSGLLGLAGVIRRKKSKAF